MRKGSHSFALSFDGFLRTPQAGNLSPAWSCPGNHAANHYSANRGSGAQPAKTTRPAVFDTMIAKAEKQLGRNDPTAAFQTLERALAIDGQAPLVWHLMAKARLSQGNFAQAQSLARKSNTLAGHRPDLKKKNWTVIAQALEKQGKTRAAADAWARGAVK